MANRISEYDKYDYDYKTYWDNRSYEDKAEEIALNKLFKREQGKRIIDIGGSYGRNLPRYGDKYEQVVIIDYSLKTLQKYRDKIQKKYPNVWLVAANAYKMPFRQHSFDGALMVRVLHHIEDVDSYYKELQRVISPSGLYIQEFANKTHLKARLGALKRGQYHDLKTLDPYQQPSQNSNEGSKEDTVFLNFHPRYIARKLQKHGFKIEQKLGASFFRLPTLKSIIPIKLLIVFEWMAQRLLSWTMSTPSLFFKTRRGGGKTDGPISATRLEDILVCPNCHNSLQFKTGQASCTSCSAEFNHDEGIWDLRV